MNYYFQASTIEDAFRLIVRPIRLGENFYAVRALADVQTSSKKCASLYNQRFEIKYKGDNLKSKENFKKKLNFF